MDIEKERCRTSPDPFETARVLSGTQRVKCSLAFVGDWRLDEG